MFVFNKVTTTKLVNYSPDIQFLVYYNCKILIEVELNKKMGTKKMPLRILEACFCTHFP